ncbi:hypothetical protein MTO96_027293 [Rhipicephalus appendiculatus]
MTDSQDSFVTAQSNLAPVGGEGHDHTATYDAAEARKIAAIEKLIATFEAEDDPEEGRDGPPPPVSEHTASDRHSPATGPPLMPHAMKEGEPESHTRPGAHRMHPEKGLEEGRAGPLPSVSEHTASDRHSPATGPPHSDRHSPAAGPHHLPQKEGEPESPTRPGAHRMHPGETTSDHLTRMPAGPPHHVEQPNEAVPHRKTPTGHAEEDPEEGRTGPPPPVGEHTGSDRHFRATGPPRLPQKEGEPESHTRPGAHPMHPGHRTEDAHVGAVPGHGSDARHRPPETEGDTRSQHTTPTSAEVEHHTEKNVHEKASDEKTGEARSEHHRSRTGHTGGARGTSPPPKSDGPAPQPSTSKDVVHDKSRSATPEDHKTGSVKHSTTRHSGKKEATGERAPPPIAHASHSSPDGGKKEAAAKSPKDQKHSRWVTN